MSLHVQIKFTNPEPPAPPPPPPVANIVGWRGKHPFEPGGRAETPGGMPSILQANNSIKLYMTEAIQWMCFDMAKHFAPTTMTVKKYGAIYGDAVAMTNKTGYGNTPRANYPAGENLTSELPAFDKQRTFSGAFVTGVAVGDALLCRPGVDAIDARNFQYPHGTPQADEILQEIIERHWYCLATTNGGDQAYNFPYLLPYPVVYPFILPRDTYFPLGWFAPWNDVAYPDPLRIYLP